MNFKLDFPVTIVKCYSVKTKSKEDRWIVEGYAATDDYDLQEDLIADEALKKSENDLLENSTVLYNHNEKQPIGKVLETKFTRGGLWIKVLISKTVPDKWQQIKEGVLNKFSIAARILDAKKEFVEDLGRVANVIRHMLLLEASLVAIPANPKARALRWYVTKALRDYEAKGGEVPMTKQDVKKEAKEEKEIEKTLSEGKVPGAMKGKASNDAFKGSASDGGKDTKTDEEGKKVKKEEKVSKEKEVKPEAKEEVKEKSEKELEIEKAVSAYAKCVGREMKNGKTMSEAAKICGKGVEKPEEEETEEKDGKKSKKGTNALLQDALKETSLDRTKELISAALEASETKTQEKPKEEKEKSENLSSQIAKEVKKALKVELDERLPVTRKGITPKEEPGSTVKKSVEKINKIKDPEKRLKELLELSRSGN